MSITIKYNPNYNTYYIDFKKVKIILYNFIRGDKKIIKCILKPIVEQARDKILDKELEDNSIKASYVIFNYNLRETHY